MEKREFQSKKRYVISFLVGTFIFLFVFILSYSLSYLEFQRVSSLQYDLAYDIFSHKLDYLLFDLGICREESLDQVSRDLNFQGRIIDDLEKKLGKNNENVLARKKFYTLIELEHFEFVKFLNKECGSNILTVLFFYSNEDKDLENSEKIGRLLSTVYNRNENLMIYSFDINLESDLITNLKNKFNITDSPSVIINENVKLFNPQNIGEIEIYLK